MRPIEIADNALEPALKDLGVSRDHPALRVKIAEDTPDKGKLEVQLRGPNGPRSLFIFVLANGESSRVVSVWAGRGWKTFFAPNAKRAIAGLKRRLVTALRRRAERAGVPVKGAVQLQRGRNAGEAGIVDDKDCTVEALANAAGISYADAHAFWELLGRERGHGIRMFHELKKHANALFSWDEFNVELLGVKMIRVKEAHGVQVRTAAKMLPQGRHLLNVLGHALAIIDGVVVDSGSGSLGKRVVNIYRVEKLA
jgi:hypothetical protein